MRTRSKMTALEVKSEGGGKNVRPDIDGLFLSAKKKRGDPWQKKSLPLVL